MLSDEEIDKLYEIDNYIEAAEKANVLYIERYDIWQMDRVTLKAFAKLVADVATAKEREWWKEHIKKDIDTAKKEEREACAELVEMNAEKCKKDMMAKLLLLSNADAIRARGETTLRGEA